MDAARLAAADQLREDDRQPAVAGGVADVVLARARRGRVDDELLRGRVVGRGGLQRLHVRAVVALAHREAAGQLEPRDRGQVALVVAHRPEVQDGAAEQAELDAALHQQAQVAERERLEAGDRAADVAEPAELGRVAHRGPAAHRQLLRPLRDARAVLVARQVGDGRVAGLGQPVADHRADLRLGPVEQRPERGGAAHASSSRVGGCAPARLHVIAAARQANRGRVGDGVAVAEVVAPQPALGPAREPAAAEGVAGADRVDDVDGRRRHRELAVRASAPARRRRRG